MPGFSKRKSPHPEPFPYDKKRICSGHYTDAYFLNAGQILDRLVADSYHFGGEYPALSTEKGLAAGVSVGSIPAEMHFFTRRKPWSVVCGVHHALHLIRECAGGARKQKGFRAEVDLEVEAVPEGTRVKPWAPVLVLRGEYRRYAHLETVLLGILARETKIATNVYRMLKASRGKPILFFPARFDLPQTQTLDGYAYRAAVEQYNNETGKKVKPFVSTQAQAELWGGQASGTVPHAYLLCFLRDTAEAMVQYARVLPTTMKRIALVDVNNDSVTDSIRTATTLFQEYRRCLRAGDRRGAERYRLFAVRLDTADNMVDASLAPGGDPGVTPDLVRLVRRALDQAPDELGFHGAEKTLAQRFFREIRIVATGGFREEKIRDFERRRVPVDVYGVGSAFLEGKNDYTADVMRVRIGGRWVPMAKVGRRARKNEALRKVKLE